VIWFLGGSGVPGVQREGDSKRVGGDWMVGWVDEWMGEDDIWVTETEGEGKVVDILKVERDLKVCFSRLGMHSHNGPLLSYK
jgi:hypothetical protein